MEAGALEARVAALLAVVGRESPVDGLRALRAGGNNRVFHLQCGTEQFVAKWYYSSPDDGRDRLQSEFLFAKHAWSVGLRCLPQPVASDPESRIALYEYVPGARIEPDTVDRELVIAAASFFARLNSAASRARASQLPAASEACFSIRHHAQMLHTRLDRLASIQDATPIDCEAIAFVAELQRAWDVVRGQLDTKAGSLEAELPASWRCLSPSDFGFHNALRRETGEVCFLDFEYAGWDDPAKMIGDFFAHPGCPVAGEYYSAFVSAALSPFEDIDRIATRARLLEPIFRIKWCCIILNEFLGDAARRRAFADPSGDPDRRKSRQLTKARALFQTISQQGN